MTSEILLSIYDKRLTQSRVSSNRHLEILSPGDQKFFEGTISGFPEVYFNVKGKKTYRSNKRLFTISDSRYSCYSSDI